VRRRSFIAGLGSTAAWSVAARAQQGERMRRIGVLMTTGEDDAEGRARAAAFVDGLREIGMDEGRNVRLDYRWGGTEAERLRTLASGLLTFRPDVLLAGSSPSLAALKGTMTTIPIVFVSVSDPVGQGFVESLAHPGANITGFSNFEFSIIGKWVELVKQIAPMTKRFGVIFNPDTAPYALHYLHAFEDAARSLAAEPVTIPVRSDGEIEGAIAALAQSDGGLIVMTDTFTTARRQVIVWLTSRYRVPALYPGRVFTAEGGLMSYGADVPDLFRRSASYVNRILNGAKPRDLPIQQPTKFELVINLKTAKALGLTIPETLLATADEVIQ
jgi:putative tryptophan/tyrosine transport system substrate-binding protein